MCVTKSAKGRWPAGTNQGHKLAEYVVVGLPQMTSGLRLDHKRLTDAVINGVWRVLPGYSPEHLSLQELRSYVSGNIRLATTVLARGHAPTRDEFGRAIELGASRALQGIPLDSVIQAFRVGERTMLDEILRHLPELETDEVRGSIDLLVTTYDMLTQECITSYRQASDEIALHHEQLERDLVGSLAIGDERDIAPSHVEQQAKLLGADPGQPHRAIALLCRHGSDPPTMLRVRQHVLRNLSDIVEGRILFGAVSGTGMLLIPGGQDEQPILAALDRALHQRTLRDVAVAGVGTLAPELRHVAPSCHHAMATAEVLHRQGAERAAARWRDVLVDAALLQDRGLSDHLITSRLGALRSHQYLIDTLRAFLDCNLSQTETARVLIVHPNTVAYRLRRIHDLTAKDPRRFAEALELALALRASDLLTEINQDVGAD